MCSKTINQFISIEGILNTEDKLLNINPFVCNHINRKPIPAHLSNGWFNTKLIGV